MIEDAMEIDSRQYVKWLKYIFYLHKIRVARLFLLFENHQLYVSLVCANRLLIERIARPHVL